MTTANKARAALLLLKQPLSAPPPETIPSQHGLMMSRVSNPAHAEWIKQVIARLCALCDVKGIPKEASGEPNWFLLAYHLARDYHPDFKIRNRGGRLKSRDTSERKIARQELHRIVEEKRASPRASKLSDESVAENLLKNKKKHPLAKPFDGIKTVRALRAEIAQARREHNERAAMEDYLKLLAPVPGTDFSKGLFGLSGLGLSAMFRPEDKDGPG